MSPVHVGETALTTAEERVRHVVMKWMTVQPPDILYGLADAFDSGPVSDTRVSKDTLHPDVGHLAHDRQSASDLAWLVILLRHAADAADVSPRTILTLSLALHRRGATPTHVTRLILVRPTDAEAIAWAHEPPSDDRLDVLLSLAGHLWAAQPDTAVAKDQTAEVGA